MRNHGREALRPGDCAESRGVVQRRPGRPAPRPEMNPAIGALKQQRRLQTRDTFQYHPTPSLHCRQFPGASDHTDNAGPLECGRRFAEKAGRKQMLGILRGRRKADDVQVPAESPVLKPVIHHEYRCRRAATPDPPGQRNAVGPDSHPQSRKTLLEQIRLITDTPPGIHPLLRGDHDGFSPSPSVPPAQQDHRAAAADQSLGHTCRHGRLAGTPGMECADTDHRPGSFGGQGGDAIVGQVAQTHRIAVAGRKQSRERIAFQWSELHWTSRTLTHAGQSIRGAPRLSHARARSDRAPSGFAATPHPRGCRTPPPIDHIQFQNRACLRTA